MSRRPVVGVMGGHAHDPETEATAHALGRRIAEEGWIVLTGGRNQGVMAAASAGCKEAGGFSVGVHPDGPSSTDVAPALDVVIHTGIGYARNPINILSSRAIVALNGDTGTLSEIAYAVTFGVPAILLGFDDKGWFGDRVQRANSVGDAIKLLRAIL